MKNKAEHKTTAFLVFMGFAFMVLGARLYYLQIMKGDYYLQRSESNFLQERVIKHNRGKILDRNGRVLVDNRLSYDLYITFALLPDSLKYLRMLGAPLKLSRKELFELDQELLLRAHDKEHDKLVLAKGIKIPTCRDLNTLIRAKMIAGVILSYDNSSCDITLDSNEFPSLFQATDRLAQLLAMDAVKFQDYWNKAQKKAHGLARFKPNLLLADIGFDAYARIENAISLGLLAGVNVVPSKRRRYIYNDFATHVIGYLNQVSLEDLKDNQNNYRSGDYIGRRGIEAAFENELKGRDGIERVMVDAKGRPFSAQWDENLEKSQQSREPEAGANLRLSIDYDLQKKAQELFLGISGSVIVMEVNSGLIRAMASFPSFDPNIIISGETGKISALLKDEKRPFRNKALQDHYSPGSTFKPFTAIAGLTKQFITPHFSHSCTGSYKIHKTLWRCFKREGHGAISLAEALRASCDSYFYELGHRMGLDNLSQSAALLGFGSLTGISVPGETSGILPSRAYYKKKSGFVAPGNVVNMSIGQGDLSVTPLQLAVAYAALANGGIIYKPQLVEEISSEHNDQRTIFHKVITSTIADASYDFAEIVQGLSHVAEQRGTAYGIRHNPKFSDIARWLKDNNMRVVGKTGTAQVVHFSKAIDHIYDVESIPYKQRDHSWFVGLFPEEKPEIVIVVMTEHAGFGGAVSTPVAVRLMKYWHEQANMHASNEEVP
jgi:penicillin-binding protein 2